MEKPTIKGPMGIWPYPLLNVILAFIFALTMMRQGQAGASDEGKPRRKIYQLLRDDKGRIVEIVEVEI